MIRTAVQVLLILAGILYLLIGMCIMVIGWKLDIRDSAYHSSKYIMIACLLMLLATQI